MDLDASAVWDFAGEIVGTITQRKGKTLATVTRIDKDGTTWVSTDGEGEAPASTSAVGVQVGDTVALEWDGATMGISSNVSSPAPSGGTFAAVTERVQSVASAAQKVADAVNQHFFADTHGIHVTSATQDEWDEQHAGPNVLINSLGQLFRDGLNNLLTLTTENGARALTVWDGLGNADANVRAIIGETIQLGNESGDNVLIDSSGMTVRTGTTAMSRVMQTSKTWLDYVRKVTVTAVVTGIDILGGFDGGGASIFASPQSDGVDAHILAGSPASSASAGCDLASVRKWANSNKYDSAIVETAVHSDGTSPHARIAATNGDRESVAVRVDCTADRPATIHADNFYLKSWANGDGVLTTTKAFPCHGNVAQGTNVPAGGYADVSVSFNHIYTSAPTVVAGLLSTSAAGAIGSISVAVRSVTTAGFTARLFNAGTSDRAPGFYWIALG